MPVVSTPPVRTSHQRTEAGTLAWPLGLTSPSLELSNLAAGEGLGLLDPGPSLLCPFIQPSAGPCCVLPIPPQLNPSI